MFMDNQKLVKLCSLALIHLFISLFMQSNIYCMPAMYQALCWVPGIQL